MADILMPLLLIIQLVCVVLFFVGFIMLFFESQRKLAAKIMIGCTIVFLIGFGVCLFSMNL